MIITKEECDQYFDRGYFDPLTVLSESECRTFLTTFRNSNHEPPLEWGKGYACSSRLFYSIGTHPAILNVVRALIGEDVLLWGASTRMMPTGEMHPWHSDIETSAPSGRTVSVWIGIENTSHDSSLSIVPYSHHFGVTVQEERHRFGKRRDHTTDEDILYWARNRDKRSYVAKPKVTNGQALFFDGRLWHASHNVSDKTRQALLLQYASPDTVIRMPNQNNLDWPFDETNLPKPPCIIVSGSADMSTNRIVSAPGGNSHPQLTSGVHTLQTPLPPDPKTGWKEYPIFSGSTPDLQILTCHVSALPQFQCPHPPHTHDREEILLLLSGEVDLNLPDLQPSQTKHLRPQQLVYYPANFHHTLATTSSEPANYLMLKWVAGTEAASEPVSTDRFRFYDLSDYSTIEDGYQWNLVFEGPTGCLRKLHCHMSALTAGAGYGQHVDSYDVCIIVLEGEVETLGKRLGRHSVIFHPAGEPHDLRNPGKATARYVVFEFHSRRAATLPEKFSVPHRSLLSKVLDPQCWIRAYRTFAWRLSTRLSLTFGQNRIRRP
jgi:mannose-6-phosphate isomerase-like protein (cupin superfamily)